MTTSRGRRFAAVLGAAGITLVCAVPAAFAMQPEPQMMFESGALVGAAPVGGMMGGPLPGMRGDPEPMRGEPDGRRGGPPPLLPPFIRLSSEQQDKLFELRHAQEPAVRAQMKELHSAHAQLHALALADTYDEARARQIATRAAQANSEVALLHARLQHAAFLLLTPEQRKRLEQCKPGSDGAPPAECPAPPR